MMTPPAASAATAVVNTRAAMSAAMISSDPIRPEIGLADIHRDDSRSCAYVRIGPLLSAWKTRAICWVGADRSDILDPSPLGATCRGHGYYVT